MLKSIHPHKTLPDELENNKGYDVCKPILLPLLLYPILLPFVLGPVLVHGLYVG